MIERFNNKDNSEGHKDKDIVKNPKRRQVIKGFGAALVSVPVYGVLSGKEAQAREVGGKIRDVAEPQELASIEAPAIQKSLPGTEILTSQIMSFNVPDPDPLQVLGENTGLIISKRFHRFWLYKDGKLILEGPVGTADYTQGYDTPEGLYAVYRKEGENYSSREFPSYDPNVPNMAYATFFNNRGIAIHGSLNIINRAGMEFLRIDSSHGCVNARKSDARIVQETLNYEDKVAILP